MLKTQNAPPDHVTVMRLELRKHEYEICATVSLVHLNNIRSIKGEKYMVAPVYW